MDKSFKITGLVVIAPGSNSYAISLLNAYKEAGVTIFCEKHNFFVSNIIPDFVHIHWPELIVDWIPFVENKEDLKLEIIKNRLEWYKKNRSIIILTLHNIVPHSNNKGEFNNRLYSLVFDYVDIFIHHCNKSVEIFRLHYNLKGKKHVIAHHGDYLHDFYKVEKKIAREKLGIKTDKFVILNFGQQRKYKGLKFINSVFKKLKIKEKYLINAGNFSYADLSVFKKYLLKFINYYKCEIRFSKKKYYLNSIKQNEIATLFSAADLVFLGHQSGLSSGILAMAATFSIPVVFPDIGCFKEQVQGWIFETYVAGDIISAENSIVSIYKVIQNNSLKFDNQNWIKLNSWRSHVNNILNAIFLLNNNRL